MSIIEHVFTGKYKGFPLTITAASTVGGKKVSIKEFPNSDNQTVEELGLRPRKYSMDVVVTGATTDDYFPQKFALLEIIEKPGGGLLTHPFYGDLQNMVVVDWSLIEEDASLGFGKLSIDFEVNDTLGIPETSGISLTQLESDLTSTIASQDESFAEDYNVTTSSIANVNDAVATGNNFVTSVKDATAFVGETTTELQTLSDNLQAFSANIFSLITAPAELIAAIDQVFTDVQNLFDSPSNTLAAFENLFGFGDDDIDLTIDTAINNERNANRAAFNSAIQVSALSGAYIAAAQIESSTVDEINAIAASLDAQFNKVTADENIPVSVSLGLNTASVTAQDLFDEQRLVAAELIDVHVDLRPARLISFEFYDDSTRGIEIALLNNQFDISFIDGDIQILSD